MNSTSAPAPLKDVVVLDIGTMFAGPLVATLLADFGATVIKVEPRGGDPVRNMGWRKDDESMWWLVAGRNKRTVTLNLKAPEGPDLLLQMVRRADVVVENMRPGKLEALGLGVDVLMRERPGLVVVRTTGFGQTGPYSSRAGFGTLAEAMSGFAHINGEEDGPPMLPPFGLADGTASYLGAFAAMVALWNRDHSDGTTGEVVDLSIVESLMSLLGPQVPAFDQLGVVQHRTGNRIPFNSPRNMYRAKDGKWLAISGATNTIALRVLTAIGRSDLIDDPRFATNAARLENADEVDALIAEWIAERDSAEVLDAFVKAEAAMGPVLSVEDIMNDPHFQARQVVVDMPHPTLGTVKVQDVVPRMASNPGYLRWVGRPLGADNDWWYRQELGMSEAEFIELKRREVI
ncbi:CaiB/BaiF CoA transferase family protein [Actinophytocola sp.]|uniref:CaiB/BaiF CoA transferase family protein n=1 Tax=Actinophytocola sp. TaxID=1872138 RepID=UPI003D6C6C9C